MIEFICDGCGKREQSRSGYKPSEWFVQTVDGKNYHACSRPCIEKTAEKAGTTSVVLPI